MNLKNVIIGALLLGSTSLFAQKTAEEVVQFSLEKTGGAEHLGDFSTVKLIATANSNGMEFPLTILQKGKTKMKSFITFQGNEIVQPASYDGTEAWSTNMMSLQDELMAEDATEAIKRETLDFPDALYSYDDNGYAVSLEADQTVNGKECYTLILTKPDLDVMGQKISGVTKFAIDKESGLVLVKTQESGMGLIDTALEDYRKVDGVLLPFKMSTKMNGNVVSEVTVKEYIINAPIADILFSFPK